MSRALTLTKAYAQSTRVRIFVVSVLVLIIPLFAYFSLHVSSRTNYFNDRNFRQLRNFSLQITDRIDNLGTVFGNAVDKFVKPQQGEAKPGNNPRADFQNYLDVLKTDGTNFTATHVDPIPTINPDTALKLPINIELVNEDSIPWLSFDCAATPAFANPSANKPETGTIHVVAKTNFDQLIKPLISKTEDEGLPKGDIGEDFDHIIIARVDNGKVLFQQTNNDLTITSLEHIPLADNPEKTLDLQKRSKTTDAADVTIAGARYKLYVQPIEIALPTKDSKDPGTLWVICGLVEAGRFRYQTWAISYTVLIISGFIAGLLLLSWPFLKLIFIGPKDRLRPTELYILAVSVIIAASLLTFFVLFAVTYRSLEHKLDGQLVSLANGIQTNFQSEVGKALREIDSLDSQRVGRPQSENIVRTGFLQDTCKEGRCDSIKNPYPYFKTAFWIDDSGQQVAKWSISNQTTKRVPVATRDYFSKLRDGYHRDLDGEKFWLEPISSKNTGGFTVVISKDAAPDTNPDTDLNASVVAIDTNLMSLMKPAIVAGFGYRIIDANGDVLFPRVKENFFAECENDHQLRSAVSGHLNEFFSVPYLGRDARVYVRPLEGLPDWTLVVFRDKEPLRSTYLEIVALSASLFFIYLLPFLLVLVIMFLIALVKGKRMKWMWPSSDSAPVYLQSIPIIVLITFVAYKISDKLPDYGSVLLLSLLSVTVLLLLILQLKYKLALGASVRLAKFLERRWPIINYRSLYALCLVAVVFVISFLPSVTFFHLAHNEQMDLFIKYGQVTVVNSLNEREERVRAAYPISIFENRQAADTFIGARLAENLDRYYAFFFGTRITDDMPDNAVTEVSRGSLLQALTRLIPFSSQSSIVRHGLIRTQSADDLWQWTSGGDTLTLRAPQGSAKGKAFVNMVSAPPRFNLRTSSLLILLALTVPLLFLLIRFILNRIFLLDAIKESNPESDESMLSDAGKLFIVLGSPYTRRDRLLKQANFQVLNLKTEAINGQWLENFDLDKFLSEASSKSIAIDCFEYQIGEPQQNLQKLYLLERLMTHPSALVIASTAEPGDYVFETGNTASNQLGTADAAARWARVISQFWVRYLEDKGEPDEFKAEVDQIRRKSHQADASIKTGEREEELYCFLVSECVPRACLQDIGREIAKRRDFKISHQDKIIEQVLEQAGTYYRFVWDSSSPTEKLTMAHLAMDGFLSAHDPDIPRLVRRGLIMRDPAVRLMNESFRLFVLTESGTDKDVAETEGQARKSSSWQYLKVALSVTVVVVMVFLFATQRDLYNSTLVALTSIAAGIPTIFSFFNLFQNKMGATRNPS